MVAASMQVYSHAGCQEGYSHADDQKGHRLVDWLQKFQNYISYRVNQVDAARHQVYSHAGCQEGYSHGGHQMGYRPVTSKHGCRPGDGRRLPDLPYKRCKFGSFVASLQVCNPTDLHKGYRPADWFPWYCNCRFY